jgi:uncharacterized protein YdaU (DUF1376 family)
MNEDKKTRKAPAFQFYADDFLAGTLEMSQEEVGQYIRLLCHQWNRGSIPVETEKQQRLTGGCVSVDVLVKFRLCEDGLLRNERLETVRSEKDRYLQQQSQKGRKSAELRKLAATGSQPDPQPKSNSGSTVVEIRLQPKVNSPSPTPTPNKKDTATPKSQWDVGFGVELPESLRTDSCLQAVKLWLQYKSEKREGYKKTGLAASLTKWSREFTAAEFPSTVENSIASGWKGIFPKKDSQQSLPINSNGSTKLSMDISQYQ